ncbi:hypothetical protein INT43_005678 [Umbelopsis isabellina]|uniref:Phospholipase D/nuclease n=1 Tax=Mortierella isabellina TaxID=91625 RepID=A0A8H7UE04_MORIS|nr:hypothetical protein INT43_005678 [Umbelopsis isabellina]
MSNNDGDMEEAIQQSLQQLKEDLERQEREKEEMRQAIALSLGKPIENLTPRETLSLTLNSGVKRSNDGQSNSSEQTKRQKQADMLTYPNGTVKLTHVKGFSGLDYLTIDQVIEAKYLKKALMTAFVVDMNFVEEKFPSDINVCIVMHNRPAKSFQISPKRVVVNPPMKDEKFGVFHSKLMLLFHQSSMRVVISSANFVDYDWNDLENVVFLQDFPMLEGDPAADADALPKFGRDIYEQLYLMGVPISVRTELLKYDFSKATAHIVASVSGSHEGQSNYARFGHTRLSSVIRQMGMQQKDMAAGPTIELQTSSLGSMNIPYLKELYLSFCGIDTFGSEGAIIQKEYKKTPGVPPATIVYPSNFTINNSRLGPGGASTICFNVASWKKPSFPREIMRDAVSNRYGTLMHSKVSHLRNIIVISNIISLRSNSTLLPHTIKPYKASKDGSHNSTMAAWGKASMSRDSKQPKMVISNWELGVVLPILNDGGDDKHICQGIPVPFARPAERYLSDQEPWTQDLWP